MRSKYAVTHASNACVSTHDWRDNCRAHACVSTHEHRGDDKAMAAPRPQPRFPEPDTQPFWEATKRHELTYQTCNKCNAVIFYPRSHCTKCGSGETTRRVSGGLGTVYTFTVIMQSRNPAFAELGAYAVAYVDLDEGFRIMTNIVGLQDPT